MKPLSERLRWLLKRKYSYRDCFQEPDGATLSNAGAIVIRDLARFCRVYQGNAPRGVSGAIDPIAMAMAEGRRQVFLRIQAQLNVSEADILKANEEDV